MNGRNVKKVVLSRSLGNQLERSDHKLRRTESQVAGIKEFHEAGKEMLQIGKDKAARKELSRNYTLRNDRLGKARRFAEKYTPDEVAELCALRKPDGTPLQVGYLDSLLSLPWKTEADRCKRAAIQKEAAEKGWSVEELAAEIKVRYPKPRRQTTSGKQLGRPLKPMRIDLSVRKIRARLGDLIRQIRNSSGVDEMYVADFLELQSEARSFAAMAIQVVRWAA